ncbi:MAG TPA: hypothetical protein VMV18_12480 [bacterium]|nr:hypothetical protein [bacterium]
MKSFLLPRFPPCPACGGKSAPTDGKPSLAGKIVAVTAFTLMMVGFVLTITAKSFLNSGEGIAVFLAGMLLVRMLLVRAARAGKFLCMRCKERFTADPAA